MLTTIPKDEYNVVQKFNHLHCMIDLETLGTEPGCPILSIGAVYWVPSYDILVHKFYTEIDLSTYDLKEFPVNPDTLKWWLKQNPKAMELLSNNSGISLYQALESFNAASFHALSRWKGLATLGELEFEDGIKGIWANGPTFDISILKHCFKHSDLKWNIHRYYNERCFRTFMDFCPVKVDMDKIREGVYHNALDDALTQTKAVMKAYLFYRYQRNEIPKQLKGLVERVITKEDSE